MNNKPIQHQGRTLFPGETKFFKDVENGHLFKTRVSPVIHTKSEDVFFPPTMPVILLKAF